MRSSILISIAITLGLAAAAPIENTQSATLQNEAAAELPNKRAPAIADQPEPILKREPQISVDLGGAGGDYCSPEEKAALEAQFGVGNANTGCLN
jgi:hypothetical protein